MRIIAGADSAGFKDGQIGKLNKPIRLYPFKDNSIIFADINNHAIRTVTLDGKVKTISGGPDKKGFLDGPAEKAKFNSPHGVAYDAATGNIYVAEAGNHDIRCVCPQDDGSYMVSTIAGIPQKAGFRDGGADSAMFISPHSLAMDADGGIIVADIGNARIRRIKDGAVTTIGGKGIPGSKDGRPLDATFKYVMDLVMAGESILIADAGTHLIRKLNPGKEVTTIVLKDTLNTPHGIAWDKTGTIYIADMGSHRVLAIDQSGEIQTVAGTGIAGSKLNELNKPAAVLVHANHLWIADLNNHQIKVIKL